MGQVQICLIPDLAWVIIEEEGPGANARLGSRCKGMRKLQFIIRCRVKDQELRGRKLGTESKGRNEQRLGRQQDWGLRQRPARPRFFLQTVMSCLEDLLGSEKMHLLILL
jgi:hypothetical protein